MSTSIDTKRLGIGLLIVLLSSLIMPAIFVALARLGLVSDLNLGPHWPMVDQHQP